MKLPLLLVSTYIFPIKSCKGCKVSEIVTDAYGVVGDRRFMLVDGRGRFISQMKYQNGQKNKEKQCYGLTLLECRSW